MAGPGLVSLSSHGLSSHPASHTLWPAEERVPTHKYGYLCVNRHIICACVQEDVCVLCVCAVGARGVFRASAVDSRVSQP